MKRKQTATETNTNTTTSTEPTTSTTTSTESTEPTTSTTTSTESTESTTNTTITTKKCDVCNKIFSCAPSLSRHKKKHTSSSDGTECPSCHKIVKGERKDNFERHVASCTKKNSSHHEKAASKRCNKCNLSFVTKQHLDRHKKTKKHLLGQKQKAVKVKVPKKAARKTKKNKLEEWEDGYQEEEDMSFELATMAGNIDHHPNFEADTDSDNADDDVGMSDNGQNGDIDFTFDAMFPIITSTPAADTATATSSPTQGPITGTTKASSFPEYPSSDTDSDDSQNGIPDKPYSSGWNHVGDFRSLDEIFPETPTIFPETPTPTFPENEQSPEVYTVVISPNFETNEQSMADVTSTTTNNLSNTTTTNTSQLTPKRPRRRRVPDGTPKTEALRDRKKISNRKSRAVSKISKLIVESLKKNKIPDGAKGEIVVKALEDCDMMKKVLEIKKVVKPRGITRTSDATINLVWSFWNENSTITNAQTNRPAKCSADEFDKDPLLSRIDLTKWNIQETKTKRNKRQYTHQFQVQNATKDELYRKFKRDQQDVKLGITTYGKLKPFYVRACKPCDIETCTCRTHVNFRNAVEALLKYLRSVNKTMTMMDDGSEIDVLASYRGFRKFLYQDCSRDEHGILVLACESGDCSHWMKNWETFVTTVVRNDQQSSSDETIQIRPPEEDKITFQRFEYEVTEKFGRKLAESNSPVTKDEILEYITGKLPGFVSHSNQRSRDYILWKIWENVILPSCTLIYMDFSENLSLPIQSEPQSLYWIRKQISILAEIIKYRAEDTGEEVKVYSAHISDDKDHEQVYVRKSLDDLVDTYPVIKAMVLRSDNAIHFKSAENIDDCQAICNKLGKMLVRVFGIAGHGKGEIDSCGGHMKNPVREAIANNVHVTTDKEAADYLNDHYENKIFPAYDVRTLESNDLQKEREKRLYKDYQTVRGTDSFHVLVFTPESKTFIASSHLCVCAYCVDMDFKKCDTFKPYQPLVGQMNEKATRSKASGMVEDQPELTISGMVKQNSIFAVRADNAMTNYFLLICTVEEKEHLDVDPYIDECGNAIRFGTKYLQGNYLECRNFTNKYHEFSPSTRAKTIAVIGECVFFPQVPILFTSKGNTYYRVSNDIIHELQVRSTMTVE